MAIGFPEPGLGGGGGKLTRTALTERPGLSIPLVKFLGRDSPRGSCALPQNIPLINSDYRNY